MITNYYTLLKIKESADLYDIKKAFRKEIAIYHPDNNKSPNAKAQFNLLVEAFDILSNTEKRKAYDELLKSQTTNKPVVIEKKEKYKEWQEESKKKSKEYYDFGLEELLLVDLFILNGDVLDGLFSGLEDLTDGLGDVFDLF